MEFIQQNLTWVLLAAISGGMLLVPFFSRGAGGVSPAEATLLVNREDAIVLDVRETHEWDAGHIPQSRHISASQLAERLVEIDKFKDKPIIVCCASGMRSNKACGELKKQGFEKLYNLTGGVDAWVGAGYPIKKGAKSK